LAHLVEGDLAAEEANGTIDERATGVRIFDCDIKLKFTVAGREYDMPVSTKAHLYVSGNNHYKIFVEETEWFIDPLPCTSLATSISLCTLAWTPKTAMASASK
jgi:hypothetical protein